MTLVPYFARKSSVIRLTCLSSLAVTVNLTVSPSTTFTGLSGEIFNVGGCVSGASVGITELLFSETTTPPLSTVVSALRGFPGKAPDTVILAVVPFDVPCPITRSPSYNFTTEPSLTPLPTLTSIV